MAWNQSRAVGREDVSRLDIENALARAGREMAPFQLYIMFCLSLETGQCI